jgi:uncharacterized membrane protein
VTLDLACTLANASVVPAWLLLALAPDAAVTRRLVHSFAYPLVLGALYAALALWLFTASPAPEGAGFGSLRGVMLLFATPLAVLVGWVHYLVFDLFVGAWEARDARRHGLAHALLLPCLALTFLLGPSGLLLYLALRYALRGASGLDEAASG